MVAAAAAAPFSVGDVVDVAPRRGPGFNKPGGIARVTAVSSTTLDVKYTVVGGGEKGLALWDLNDKGKSIVQPHHDAAPALRHEPEQGALSPRSAMREIATLRAKAAHQERRAQSLAHQVAAREWENSQMRSAMNQSARTATEAFAAADEATAQARTATTECAQLEGKLYTAQRVAGEMVVDQSVQAREAAEAAAPARAKQRTKNLKEELAVTVKQLAAAAAQASVAHARAGRSDVTCASALEAVSDLEAQNKSLRVALSRLRNVVADREADLGRLRDSAQRRRERNHNASWKQNVTVLHAFKRASSTRPPDLQSSPIASLTQNERMWRWRARLRCSACATGARSQTVA